MAVTSILLAVSPQKILSRIFLLRTRKKEKKLQAQNIMEDTYDHQEAWKR
jgi:hypothetical protein